ncbi:MAG: hypothetical protein JNL57_09995 [Bacteroidetes bacterium]|nr:hypothetical protein [Bacteroidota bacterium]
MNQRKKLLVATGFFTAISALCIYFYFTTLRPIHQRRIAQADTVKYTMKKSPRTRYNPAYIDSVIRAKEKAAKKHKN